MSKLFSQSNDMKKEYCCSIVKIGEVLPIKDSDFLGTTLVEGFPVVVRKDQVFEGDIMFYAENECQLDHEFCRKNNLFDDKTMNIDPEKKGFFNKHSRVRVIKLRGQESVGYLFTSKEMAAYIGGIKESDIEKEMDVGMEFDTVNGSLFVKPYVPERKRNMPHGGGRNGKQFKVFDRTIPNEVVKHYDTDQFEKGVYGFRPKDFITVSVKLHGQSGIFGNLRVNMPIFGGLYTKYFMYLPKFLRKTRKVYDYICSSRQVIRNGSVIEEERKDGKYGDNVWLKYNDLFKKYGILDDGTTVYGEIIGFDDNGKAMQTIGKPYDYKCAPGENKLMVYRIHQRDKYGNSFEWNVNEVLDWTKMVMRNYPELANHLHPIDLLYTGSLQDLYPELIESAEFKRRISLRPEPENEDEDAKARRLNFNEKLSEELARLKKYLDVEMHTICGYLNGEAEFGDIILRAWQECLLLTMKTDKRFNIEGLEPLCNNKVYREGIVIRKHNDEIEEAFKLKSSNFRMAEAKKIDAGEVDSEMDEGY